MALSVWLSLMLGQLPGWGELHVPKGLSQQQPSPPNKAPPNLHQQGQGLGRPWGDVLCFPVPPPPLLTDMLCVSGLQWVHKRVADKVSWWAWSLGALVSVSY